MSVEASACNLPPGSCAACHGSKNAPIACSLTFGEEGPFCLCEICARDLSNAVGFFCVRNGGWSKLEPRKRKANP